MKLITYKDNLMPMLDMKELMDVVTAANRTYKQILSVRETLLHNMATSVISFVGYEEDTSAAKAAIFNKLATQEYTGNAEEQCKQLITEIKALEQHAFFTNKPGENFKAITNILLNFAKLAENLQEGSLVDMDNALSSCSLLQQSELIQTAKQTLKNVEQKRATLLQEAQGEISGLKGTVKSLETQATVDKGELGQLREFVRNHKNKKLMTYSQVLTLFPSAPQQTPPKKINIACLPAEPVPPKAAQR